jgi:Trypsin-like peptidase domain
MKKSTLGHFTLEELYGELRHRERRQAYAGKRGRAVARRSARAGLASVPTSALVQALRRRQRVVYGVDDRKDLYQVTRKKVLEAADAVAALVEAANLTENADGTFSLATEPYKTEYHLCSGEPFASQSTGCFCSGFLVAADVVATAGHCVKSASDLGGIRFVFGFRMLNASAARTTFQPADVYRGVELLGREELGSGPDWALVRLDRPVVGRTPLRVRTSGKIRNSQSVFVIGHPSGLPTKYADGAQVRDNTPNAFFVANLDTYGGNSGSPVFNKQSAWVEGILVRGEQDYVSNGTCNVTLVCPSTGCRGEDVTRSTVWAGTIPKRASKARRGRRR